ncbi:3-ketodihydrosphingosine reductase-like isoform X3 [Symsagittifera roscoffensis]|uniref:3-ketodihydrosphingosine reductase-like isoform X3 n=1 Tax=Symsagittifera roscoffensis TaxID=84072 RepID=UPI00307BEDE2
MINISSKAVIVPAVLRLRDSLDGSYYLRVKKPLSPLSGSSGIGLSIADCLLRKYGEDVTVTLVARNKSKLDQARETLLTKSGRPANCVQVFSCDVSNYEELDRTVTAACKQCQKPVTGLICSAGISSHRLLQDTSTDLFKDMMDINVQGSFNAVKVLFTQAVLPFMSGVCNNDSEKGEAAGGDSMESATAVSQSLRESSGAKYKPGFICLLSSQAGSIGLIGYTAYSASKFALRGLAEALQMELRPHNVFVTLTHPPDTETPSLKKENEERSELLKKIAGTACMWSSDMVAHKILFDISNNVFLSHFGVIGWLLSLATASCAPIHSISQFITEVLLAGVARFIVLFFHYDFDVKIKREMRPEKSKKEL